MSKRTEYVGDRAVISFRPDKAMREALEREASAANRSLSSEIGHRIKASFSSDAPDLRTIIREEIRAALGIVGPFSDPKEFTASLRQAVADLPDEEHRLYGPRPELVGNLPAEQIARYGKTLSCGLTQTYDRSALNRKQ